MLPLTVASPMPSPPILAIAIVTELRLAGVRPDTTTTVVVMYPGTGKVLCEADGDADGVLDGATEVPALGLADGVREGAIDGDLLGALDGAVVA
jgi:hypothetical protein